MAEGLQAGRLDVPVVADLSGFAAKLRSDVEAAAEGLVAKVQVKIDAKGLRKQLKRAVEEASKGVTAKIKVKVDDERFRTQLDEMRRRIDDTDLHVPVRTRGEDDRNGSGNNRGGLLGGLRRMITGAQDEADRNPVNVPAKMKLPGGRGALIGGLLALIQPAVALIGQYGAGLTAFVSAASPAVGVLGAIPGLAAAAGTALIGTKMAFSGFGDALKETLKIQQQQAAGAKITKAEQQKLNQAVSALSPSARKAVKDVAALSGAWRQVKKSISERFFSRIDGDIKPLAKATMPLLKKMLGDSAAQMGNLADRAAKAMKSPLFRKDFKTIAATNSRVIGHLTGGLGNLGHVTTDFLVASGPFVERVSRAGERMTQWMRASVQAGRETGSLARFLDHAGDTAAQLGRATGSLIKGFGGVGRASMETGQNILDGFEGSMKRFERYATSGAGQKAMKQFFAGSAPAFHEVNRLFGDMMRGLGRSMKDGGITDLIRQIRLELMPAVGHFFNALGQSVGPGLISVLSNVASAIASISDAGSGLGVLLIAFSGFAHTVNTLLHWIPGLNVALAVLLGTMVGLKIAGLVTTMLRGFATSVRAAGTNITSMNTSLRAMTAAGGANISFWGRMSRQYTMAARGGDRLSGSLRGVSAASRFGYRALGGLSGALGGGLGIALTAITIGLGMYASHQEKAARAAQAHEERVKALTDALVASGGAIDANVRAQAAQMLQETDLANGKGKLVDVMAEAGISLGKLTNAYLGQGTSLDALQKDLQATAAAHVQWKTTAQGAVQTWDDEGLAAARASDAIGMVKGELGDSQKKHKELAKAINDSGSTGTSSYERLQAAVQSFGDQTKSADERVNALKLAMDALKGNATSFHDAEAQLNAVMLQIDDTMKSNIEKADGWGKSLVGSDGLVKTSTKNGQTLNSQLSELRDNMLAVTTKAQEAGEKGWMPMSEAMAKSDKAMEAARKKAIELARDMGIPKDEAKALVDQMGFIPDEVTTNVVASGVPEATGEFLALRGQLEGLKGGAKVMIDAPTAGAQAQLKALGFTVTKLPHSHKVIVTAPTGGARVDIASLVADIAAAPDKKKVTIQAIISKAVGDLKGVQEKVAGLKPKKSITVTAPTAVAQKALKDLGYKIEKVDKGGKKVKITAPNATPLAQVQRIQDKINGLVGTTVHVTVQYSEKGKPAVVRTHADGGIVTYANGGIRAAANRIKAFAAGAENHIAQIGRPGEIRMWNEPETQGEAYIPLAPGKRRRSEAILEKVAEMFGGQVVYFAQGAMRQYAQGGVRTRATTVRQRVAAAQAAGSLVGGDLNLNIGAVDSTGTALEDAMFELRNIRLRGAANA